MRNLVVDIGNTNAKLAVFQDRELIDHQVHQQTGADQIDALLSYWKIGASALSSVSADASAVVELLREKTLYVPFSTAVSGGVLNFYRSIETLGPDRWAKVIAAHHLYPGHDCLMIDAGTCITFDLLNSRAEYYGGSISPGIAMRFNALNHYTGKLPLLNWNPGEMTDIPEGTDTISAIRNGVLQGVMKEVAGIIADKASGSSGLKILLTGGDAGFLLEQLKNTIFAPQIIHDPYLVLKGLNEVIIAEHVQKD